MCCCCCRMYDQFQGEMQKAQLKSSDADITKVKQVGVQSMYGYSLVFKILLAPCASPMRPGSAALPW